MNKSTIIVGIDISKDTFDTFDSQKGHSQFTNDLNGFKSFLKSLTIDRYCVMEANGFV